MNFKFVIILFILNSIYIFGQNKADYYYPKTKEVESFRTPPGTVKLNDSLSIDIAPINNMMYKEFLNSVENFWTLGVSDSLKKIPTFGITKTYMHQHFEKLQVDKNLFKLVKIHNNIKIDNSIKMNIYSNHPKYNYYPVVNISKEQAQLYCKWRTDMVQLIRATNSESEEERAKFPKRIKYRLPTTEEFKNAVVKFGYSKQITGEELPFKPYCLNYIIKEKAIFYSRNLSEFTLNGIPFETNWRNTTTFISPNDYTSFRCVCEIID